MPWKWPGAQGVLGRRYPEPVIDVALAAKAARAAMGPLRQEGRFAADAAVLIETHASPAQNPLFFNDRKAGMRRARPALAGQMCLDL